MMGREHDRRDAFSGTYVPDLITNQLADAFIIEPRGDTANCQVHRNSIANDQSFGVVHLKSVTIDQGDREWTKRRAPLKRSHRSFKVPRSHL
jgi:hypothetical protein